MSFSISFLIVTVTTWGKNTGGGNGWRNIFDLYVRGARTCLYCVSRLSVIKLATLNFVLYLQVGRLR